MKELRIILRAALSAVLKQEKPAKTKKGKPGGHPFS
jgi:hypothetical protein